MNILNYKNRLKVSIGGELIYFPIDQKNKNRRSTMKYIIQTLILIFSLNVLAGGSAGTMNHRTLDEVKGSETGILCISDRKGGGGHLN